MKLFKKLRDLEAKATHGPWTTKHEPFWHDSDNTQDFLVGPYTTSEGCSTNETEFNKKEDAVFIAEARNAIPKLLQVVDVMQEALAEIKRRDDDPFGRWWTVAHVALEKAREIAE